MSRIKQYSLELCHSFAFNNVEILEQNVGNKFKRESLENMYIIKNNNNVNFMKKSNKIDSIYHPFLN